MREVHFIEMIQEAGAVGYLAIALGGLGIALGFFAAIALLGKSPSAFTLGIATLIIGAAAAGAGIGGTFYGRSRVEAAVGFVDSSVDKERIIRQGFKEAQSSSWLGLFAALLPLALGGAAAFGGSRLKPQKSQVQRMVDPMVSSDEGSGQTMVAALFVGITALAIGGAWVVAHSALPKLSYDFGDDDNDAWHLAAALENVKSRHGANPCESLANALTPFWSPDDRSEWPRKLRPIPPALAAWRVEADRCMTHALEQLEAGDQSEGWTQNSILLSVLLQDDALHSRALAFESKAEPPKAEAPKANDAPVVGGGTVAKEAIAQAVRGAKNEVRLCYERELQKNPKLEGKITVKFVIGLNGTVTRATEDSEPKFVDAKVTGCLLSVVRKLKFPRPLGGGEVIVRYPFVFKAN